MTPNQFWYDNPRLILNYQEKFKAEQIRVQQNAWLIGAYVKSALSSTIISAGLADKDTAKKIPKYPDIPLANEKKDITEEHIKMERLRLAKYYRKFAQVNNKNSG